MAKSKYSIGGVYWHMNSLYHDSKEIEDCFLSTRDGRLIVRRFGSRVQSRAEKRALCISDLQESCPEIEACNLVHVDGFGIASTIPSSDGELRDPQQAAMMSMSNQLARAFGNDSADFVRISGRLADLFLIPIKDIAILMILLKGNTASNSTQLSIQQAVGQLSELL
jgi:predicted regulator of Ras-like GTPase activity (Roadblock/LC7/MglB family)